MSTKTFGFQFLGVSNGIATYSIGAARDKVEIRVGKFNNWEAARLNGGEWHTYPTTWPHIVMVHEWLKSQTPAVNQPS